MKANWLICAATAAMIFSANAAFAGRAPCSEPGYMPNVSVGPKPTIPADLPKACAVSVGNPEVTSCPGHDAEFQGVNQRMIAWQRSLNTITAWVAGAQNFYMCEATLLQGPQVFRWPTTATPPCVPPGSEPHRAMADPPNGAKQATNDATYLAGLHDWASTATKYQICLATRP